MDFSSYFKFQNGETTYGLTTELIAFYMLELVKKLNFSSE